MDSANLKPSLIKNPSSYKEILVFLSLALCCWAGFFFLSDKLMQKGFVDELSLYLGEKVLISLHGPSPRYDTFIFTEPYFPYLLTLFFNQPLIANAFSGALCLTLVLYGIYQLYKQDQISLALAIVWLLFLCLSPLSLYFFTQASFERIFLILFILTTWTLRKYYATRLSSQFLLFGIFLGLFIANSLVELILIGIFLPAILMIIHTQKRPYFSLLMAALFTPLFFFIIKKILKIAFRYINCKNCWIEYPFPLLPPINFLLMNKNQFWQSFLTFLNTMLIYSPLILPYVLYWIMRWKGYSSKGIAFTFFILPYLLIAILIYNGIFIPGMTYSMLFILFSFLLFAKCFGPRFESTVSKSVFMIASYLLMFASSFWLFFNSPNPQEQNFLKALLNLPFKSNIEPSLHLLNSIDSEGQILTDDAINYKPIYFAALPFRFILPYQNEFKSALNNPEDFVEYILFSKNAYHDQVLQKYPQALTGQLEGFKLIEESEEMLLYQKAKQISKEI